MVKAIDDYMLVAPLKIIRLGRSQRRATRISYTGPYRFSHFESWQERWMGALYPRTLENQQKIADAGAEPPKPKDDIAAAYMQLSNDAEDFKFLFGYLMGCRAMGGTPKEMLTKAKGFALAL